MKMSLERSLLLVDDDNTFVRRLARAIKTRGFEVAIAESAAEALLYINDEAPAFAVVDLLL